MPKLTPVDESFFQTAPQRFEHTWEIASPADLVWSQLVGDRPLHWITGLNIRWTSPSPFGVGSTRLASVMGAVKMVEKYFIWEEGRRNAFYAESANLPVFTSLAEDYIVEPTGDASCRFTWKIAVEASLVGKPGAPLNSLIFGQAFRDTTKHFRAS